MKKFGLKSPTFCLSVWLAGSQTLSSLEHSVHFSSCCCLGCLVSSWRVKGSCVQRFNTLTRRTTRTHAHTHTHTHIHTYTHTCCQCMQGKHKSCNTVLCSLLTLSGKRNCMSPTYLEVINCGLKPKMGLRLAVHLGCDCTQKGKTTSFLISMKKGNNYIFM